MKEVLKMLNHRLFSSAYNIRIYQKPKLISLPRFYSNDKNIPSVRSSTEKLQKKEQEQEKENEDLDIYEPKNVSLSTQVKYWNERAAIKLEKKASKFPHSIDSPTSLIKYLQSFNDLLNLPLFFRKRHIQNQLIEQKYLKKRVAVLRPDLAAAHFIVRRGGSVKFVGNPDWVGLKAKKFYLPPTYVSGMFIEAIDAENTGLYIEGLENFKNLRYLSYLSLKNLETVDDWFLDYISQEHSSNLKHLNINGCKNVTYKGLSCFYRFEKLKILEVEGVSDTPEFKLACLMLLDIKPFLDIRGIDLNVPKEIKPAKVEENKVSVETAA